MSTSPSMFISSAFVDALADYLQGAGVDAPEIMAPLLPYAGSAHMPALLLMAQLEQLRSRHPVTALGFRIGRCVRPQHFGVVGYLTQYCNSLGEALVHYYRFQKLVLSALSLQVHMEDSILVCRWHNGEDQPSLLTDEFSVAASVSLYQALIGQRVPPAFIELPHPRPIDAGLHEVLIGCPIRFDSPCLGLALPTNLLAMRVATSDPFLRKLLDEQAAGLLTSAAPDAFLAVLRQHIAAALIEGEPSALQIAARQGLALRTFYRELAQRGLRYRTVLADVRFGLAQSYLTDHRLSMVEISLLLGYSEQSAFARAFKSWSGMTPGTARQLQL